MGLIHAIYFFILIVLIKKTNGTSTVSTPTSTSKSMSTSKPTSKPTSMPTPTTTMLTTTHSMSMSTSKSITTTKAATTTTNFIVSTTTIPTTVTTTTITNAIVEDSNTTEANITEFFGPCNTTVLDENKHKIVKYLMYFSSFWIIICCLITILITLCHKECGHHRFLNLLQELAFIFLFVILAVLMWDHDKKKVCIGATIAYQYVMVLILAFFFFEAIFANSLIKGSSVKNGSVPAVLNYILPFIIAAIPTVISYFTSKDDYAYTEVHCFVSIYTKLFWAFVVPAWFLTSNIIFTGQLSFLACEQYKPNVDRNQLYWAFKTSKARPMFVMLFMTTYFLLLFAVDMQLFSLFIAYTILCVIFGIFIIIFHTFCYLNTAAKIYKSTGLSPYKPCPSKKEPEKPKEDDPPLPPTKQEETPAPTPQQYPEPPNLYQRRPELASSPPHQANPFDATSSGKVYDWATDRNLGTMDRVENLFFKPRTM